MIIWCLTLSDLLRAHPSTGRRHIVIFHYLWLRFNVLSVWPLHFPLALTGLPSFQREIFHFSKGCLFSTNKTFIFVCLIAPALLSPFYFFCFWLRGIWTICASKTVCLNSLQADFMVFKFFTLTFSLLLAIFITVLKSASFGNDRHSMRFFRSYWNWSGAAASRWTSRGPHAAIGGRCRPGEPRGGSALPFGIESDTDAFHWRHTPPHHPVKTPDGKNLNYLPIHLSLHVYGAVITNLRTQWDTKLKQRTQRNAGGFLPARHTAVPWEPSCVIVPADMLFCFHFITVV